MQNKGQIALFIILGFVLILGISFVIYLKSQGNLQLGILTKRISEQTQDILPINLFINTCLENDFQQGLDYIYKHGGYYELPNESLFVFFLEQVPAFYVNEQKRIPDIKTIENELSKYMMFNIDSCLKNFSAFTDKGYTINYGNKNFNAAIGEEDVTVKLDFPVTIIKDNTKSELQLFTVTNNPNLKKVLEISDKLVDDYNQRPGYICISCLDDLNFDKGKFEVKLTNVFDEIFPGDVDSKRNDIVLAEIKESFSPLKNLTFRFIMNVPEEIKPPKVYLEDMGNLTAFVDYNFIYKVNALGDNITFYDKTDLFDINQKTGLINFTPTLEQVGTRLVELSAVDKFGNKDFKIVKFEIKGLVDAPTIDYLGFLDAEIDQEFFYDVNATDPHGLKVFFIDDTDLFNISLKDGIIRFIPKESQIGIHKIHIKAIDEVGGSDTREMVLRIKK